MKTLPRFNDLINQANSDLEEIDCFDLDDTNQEAFKALEQAYREDAKALVDFVLVNSAAILAELT